MILFLGNLDYYINDGCGIGKRVNKGGDMGFNKVIVAVGIVSLIIGVVSRLLCVPIPPMGLEANALLSFASTCFLLSIALSVLCCKK